jgi:hypothetical protein
MSDLNQTDLLDGMIARLEKANASAYERFAREGERAVKSGPDEAGPPSAHQDRHVTPRRKSPRAMLPLIIQVALLLAVSAGIVAYSQKPFLADGARLFARWANPWRSTTASPLQGTAQSNSASASENPSEIAERVQNMEGDLASLKQQIDQIKLGQEQIIRRDVTVSDQLKANEELIIRDNAKAADQLTAALEQMDRQTAALAKQLKANQDQLAELAAARPTSFGRRHVRRNSKRASALALQR